MAVSSLDKYSGNWNLVTALYKVATILVWDHLGIYVKNAGYTVEELSRKGPKSTFPMVKLKAWYYNE